MNEINIIDIEASGLHFDSYPIEVAVLANGKIKSWLIKPEPDWNYWSDIAEGMHGINREMLQREGLPATRVVRELSVFLKESNGLLYSDAAQWDGDWIDTLYFAVREAKPFHVGSIYDLMEPSQKVDFDKLKAKLAESSNYRHHQAAEDVKMIRDAYNLLEKDRYLDQAAPIDGLGRPSSTALGRV